MRRVVTPMRDIFASDAERITELPGLQTDDRLYFRDLYDSLVRVSELVDSTATCSAVPPTCTSRPSPTARARSQSS